MMVITIVRTGQLMRAFTVNGHANTAPHGQDIVCAAVSALSQAAVMGLERHLGRKVELTVRPGYLSCRLVAAPDELTEAILATMLIGLREVARQSAKHVRIIEQGGERDD